MLKPILTQEIETRMRQRNLSIRAIEKAADLTPNAVRYILDGDSTKPNIYLIAKIAKALNCTIHDLLGDGEYEDTIVKSRTENKISRLITDLIEELKAINYLTQKEGVTIERMDLFKECLNYELDSSDPRNLNFNKIQSIALENYNKKMNTLRSKIESLSSEETSSKTERRFKDKEIA